MRALLGEPVKRKSVLKIPFDWGLHRRLAAREVRFAMLIGVFVSGAGSVLAGTLSLLPRKVSVAVTFTRGSTDKRLIIYQRPADGDDIFAKRLGIQGISACSRRHLSFGPPPSDIFTGFQRSAFSVIGLLSAAVEPVDCFFFEPIKGEMNRIDIGSNAPSGKDNEFRFVDGEALYPPVLILGNSSLQRGSRFKCLRFAAQEIRNFDGGSDDTSDTTETRLRRLENGLESALEVLRGAPIVANGYFDRPIKDLVRAQASVAHGFAYLSGHPEARKLDLPMKADPKYQTGRVGFPNAKDWGLLQGSLALGDPNVFPDFHKAGDNLINAFGAIGSNPSIGELGGVRDIIIRDLAIAVLDLENSNRAFVLQVVRKLSGQMLPPESSATPFASTNTVSSPGSISGVVTASIGSFRAPLSDSLVYIAAVPSLDWKDRSNGTPLVSPTGLEAAIPCTVSSLTGSFRIQNVPPGIYGITAGKNVIVIEIKLGEDIKLGGPLEVPILEHKPMGGG